MLLFNSFSDYIKQLAQLHKDVLHSDTSNRAFIRMFSHDDINTITSIASKYVISLSYFTGRATGDVESDMLRQEASLQFLRRADESGDPGINVQVAMNAAMTLMFDFYARIKKDFADDDCGVLKYLQPEQMTFQPVDDVQIEAHYGWEMTLPFGSAAPAYNADKWNT